MSNPEQRTFYKDRVFVVYEPQEYRNYFRKLVKPKMNDPLPKESDVLAADVALDAWATVLVYQSRLSLFNFRKLLFGLFEAEGRFSSRRAVDPLKRGDAERQAFTMQLAIETVARRSDVQARVAREPYYMRLIYDALYSLSALHEIVTPVNLNWNFVVSPDKLRDYLLRSSEPGLSKASKLDSGGSALDPQKAQNEPEKPTKIAIEPTVLFGYLNDYLQLLSRPEKIREETIKYARGLDDEDRRRWFALAESLEMRPIISHLAPGRTASSLSFRFMSDQYGARARSEIVDVGKLIEALEGWRKAIEGLFGDVDAAWEIAASARLAPPSPRWSEIATLATDAEREGWVTIDGGGVVRASLAANPAVSKATGAGVGKGFKALNPQGAETTKAEEDPLRIERERLAGFASAASSDLLRASATLQRAFSLAKYSAAASSNGATAAQHLAALRAVARLFELDIEDTWDQRAFELRKFMEANERVSGLPPLKPEQIDSYAPKSTFSLGVSDARLVEESVAALAAWSADLLKRDEQAPGVVETESLNNLFWHQWDLPKEANGRLPRLSERQSFDAPTLVDLLHATAHKGVPVVPVRGGRLSIAQWSRIRVLAEDPAEGVPNAIKERAEVELIKPAQNRPGASQTAAVFGSSRVKLAVQIWPGSSESRAYGWLPEPDVFAFAMPPDDLIGETGKAKRQEVFEGLLRKSDLVRGLNVIDATATPGADAHFRRRLYFGHPGLAEDRKPFVPSTPSLGILLEDARKRHPDLFAVRSFWVILFSWITGRRETEDGA